ncbi:MAG: hypothetical protein O3C60_16820 [Planctomycetota bacterium]|nr:hypothetical protein [Planctomycetota bacterium]
MFVLQFVVALLIAVCLVAAVQSWKNTRRQWKLREARQQFQRRREWLEADFLKIAQGSGKPRGLVWEDLEFHDDVAFARDKSTNQLRALVAITIRFSAVEGGAMEEVEAVGNLKAATAVFTYDGRVWRAEGRTVFNLNPAETIQHYRGTLEVLD